MRLCSTWFAAAVLVCYHLFNNISITKAHHVEVDNMHPNIQSVNALPPDTPFPTTHQS